VIQFRETDSETHTHTYTHTHTHTHTHTYTRIQRETEIQREEKEEEEEDPEGDNWPGRHFFPGTICLHQRYISTLGQLKKKAIKPSFQPDPCDH
jgi:hypothetical protein